MNSFKKMVQKKRIDVLIFVILLYLLGAVNLEYDIPNVRYYASENKSMCIVNGPTKNSALAWIYPLNYTATSGFYFWPTNNNPYNINFEKVLQATWKLKDWYISDGSSLSAILDTRWEAFPTLNLNKQFKHTNEATLHIKRFPISFSILATNSIEILLCEGWNQNEYTSYYINIGGEDSKRVLFGKVDNFEHFDNKTLHETIKMNVNILSPQSWKTFHIDYDEQTGRLELSYITENKYIVIIKQDNDEKPLKPIYFLTRIVDGQARWKFHDNRYFYTNVTGIVPFGPKLVKTNNELCVSLYVAMCDECAMKFYINSTDNSTNYTDDIRTHNEDKITWQEVRLYHKNNTDESVQIYLETWQTNPHSNGFWAVDEIRVCTNEDIKISTITTNDFNLLQNSVTCQSLMEPKWRPHQNQIGYHKSLPNIHDINGTSTEINFKLSVDTVDSNDLYLYKYKAKRIETCDTQDMGYIRRNSSGYKISQSTEISITDLIPYTTYNITIFDPVTNESASHEISTAETTIPTDEEIPKNVKFTHNYFGTDISWDHIPCKCVYGHIVHLLHLEAESNATDSENISMTIPFYEHHHNFTSLRPYTNYTFKLITARDSKYFNEQPNLTIALSYSFQTPPSVAPKVKNLKAYSIDRDAIDFRFELPVDMKGVPEYMRVKCCSNGYGGKSSCVFNTSRLSRCKLWQNMYCGRVGKLKKMEYTVTVSLKNKDTNAFGDEVRLRATPKLTVPGPPTNLTYKMINCTKEVNYCHLNLTWNHPYLQLSSINSFDIILQEETDIDDFKVIKEVYKVDEYMPVYSHVICIVSYSATYQIEIKSRSELFTSSPLSMTAKMDDLGKHIKQDPIIIDKELTNITFNLAKLDNRLKSYNVMVIVQDDDATQKNVTRAVGLHNFDTSILCQNYGNLWISNYIEVNDSNDYNITIGDDRKYLDDLGETIYNKQLEPRRKYCLTFAITNEHGDNFHEVFYYVKNLQTKEEIVMLENGSSAVLIVVILLFVLAALGIAGYIAYRYLKQREFRLRARNDGEPVYMSLESLPGAVSNDTYDKLIH